MRRDFPGAWHHVMNRGQARRPVFQKRAHVRYFLSRLAREVRRGELEVHSFCLMTTHFHLMVRSPHGNLSDAMRRIENPFVRWFNRRHKRDGSLFRGRFTSRRIDSDSYRKNVRRYIDNNPVVARLVRHPFQYPHGSARFHACGSLPPWLHEGERGYEPVRLSPNAVWVVERRLDSASTDDPFDDLIGAAPSRVRIWMERKARLADGPQYPECLVSLGALREAVKVVRAKIGPWKVSPRRRSRDGWEVLTLGLSRVAVGLSTLETSVHLGVPRSSAGNALLEHRHLILSNRTYSKRAAEVLRLALRLTFLDE